jgi:hypothetical protein
MSVQFTSFCHQCSDPRSQVCGADGATTPGKKRFDGMETQFSRPKKSPRPSVVTFYSYTPDIHGYPAQSSKYSHSDTTSIRTAPDLWNQLYASSLPARLGGSARPYLWVTHLRHPGKRDTCSDRHGHSARTVFNTTPN